MVTIIKITYHVACDHLFVHMSYTVNFFQDWTSSFRDVTNIHFMTRRHSKGRCTYSGPIYDPTKLPRSDLHCRDRNKFIVTIRPGQSDPFFFRISSSHIVNSVCWSHALVNGPTSNRQASDGGRCSGQLLMMWSAVCSGSPHSHDALSASPHFFMDVLNRPTPVRSLFRVVQSFRLRSSP